MMFEESAPFKFAKEQLCAKTKSPAELPPLYVVNGKSIVVINPFYIKLLVEIYVLMFLEPKKGISRLFMSNYLHVYFTRYHTNGEVLIIFDTQIHGILRYLISSFNLSNLLLPETINNKS